MPPQCRRERWRSSGSHIVVARRQALVPFGQRGLQLGQRCSARTVTTSSVGSLLMPLACHVQRLSARSSP